MADGTPDISRIIKLIMDNPKLIEEIGDMVKSEKSTKDEITPEPEKSATSEVPTVAAPKSPKARGRQELLYALKPYLSEKRSRAIDSMLSVAEVFTMLKR